MASPQRSRRSAEPAQNPNVFDDEYAVDVPETEMDHLPAPSMAQEGDTTLRTRPRTPTQASVQRRSLNSKEAGKWQSITQQPSVQQQRGWRSSIAKESRPSFDIVSPGSAGVSRMPSSNYVETHSEVRNRPTSTASSYAPYEERSGTPVHGRSESSNYYNHQFSQTPLPRAFAGSTSASPTPQRPSIYTPARPAHPYGLYQQNSIPLEDDRPASPVVPIGFPGRNNSFQRQIGPDGEEQDIVGPDGHTEELPPYSRYPDESAKVSVATPTVPVPQTGASGGTPLHSPIRQSLVQVQDDAIGRSERLGSSPQVATPQSRTPSLRSSVVSEKAWTKKSWKEKRRTRVCGGCMPLWVLLTMIALFALLVILVGGVIGGLLASEKKSKPPTVTVTSTQSMLDASLIPSPTNIPPIPTGVYLMPLGIPRESQTKCITNIDQENAWQCVAPNAPVAVEVGSPPSGFQIMKIHRSPVQPQQDGNLPRFNLSYGTQAPKVQPQIRLFWVTDLDEPMRGPALHFQTTYDKLVILEPKDFPVGGRNKRDALPVPPPHDLPPSSNPTNSLPTSDATHQDGGNSLPQSGTGIPNNPPGAPPGGFRHRKTLETGDQPWFCYWNQTWLEGFIYMNTGTQNKQRKDDKKDSKEPLPTATTTLPPTKREILPSDPDFLDAQDLFNDAINANDGMALERRSPLASPAYSIAPTPNPKPFPYVMKIEERRIPGSAQAVPPYCQRMYVPDDGPVQPISNDDGEPVRINLIESDGGHVESAKPIVHRRDAAETKGLIRRDDSQKSCHCLWVTPNPP